MGGWQRGGVELAGRAGGGGWNQAQLVTKHLVVLGGERSVRGYRKL